MIGRSRSADRDRFLDQAIRLVGVRAHLVARGHAGLPRATAVASALRIDAAREDRLEMLVDAGRPSPFLISVFTANAGM